VRPAEPKAPIGRLSGGNHQKLVCAREMGRHPVCLIVGQPTRIRALADRILMMEGGRIPGMLGPAPSERELGLLTGGGLLR
jgi:hypothetical protein